MKAINKTIIVSAFLCLGTQAFAEDDMAKHMDDMFTMCDTNKDGMISKEEFLAEKTKMFAKYDANNDGMLNKDEHEKMAMDMKKMMQGDHAMSKEKHGKM